MQESSSGLWALNLEDCKYVITLHQCYIISILWANACIHIYIYMYVYWLICFWAAVSVVMNMTRYHARKLKTIYMRTLHSFECKSQVTNVLSDGFTDGSKCIWQLTYSLVNCLNWNGFYGMDIKCWIPIEQENDITRHLPINDCCTRMYYDCFYVQIG